ncbi:MAG: peptidoglycan DD-metalloendopeptidase family protein [Chlorobiales bacterium]|nr:peptidoglycan DD-metalloendopeptidase family protein [Chlorobiales bacterium]
MRIIAGIRHRFLCHRSVLCILFMLAVLPVVRPCVAQGASQEMNRVMQERSRVENNLRDLKKQLSEYQLKLSKTTKDEASSIKALNNIRSQILVYERLIRENQSYLNTLDRQIESLGKELDVNRQNYGRVSSDFSKLAVAAYKRGGNRDAETVLSSGSMNEVLVRARYMGFMSKSVRYKVNDLQQTAEQIQSTQANLQESYRQKEAAMKVQQAQLSDFASKKKEKETVLNTIKQDKTTYTSKITEVRRKQRELQSRIESLIMAQQVIIQKEQERARLAALARQRARQARLAETRRQQAKVAAAQRQARIAESQRLATLAEMQRQAKVAEAQRQARLAEIKRLTAERQRQESAATKARLEKRLVQLRRELREQPTDIRMPVVSQREPLAVQAPPSVQDTPETRVPETVRTPVREEPLQEPVVDIEESQIERVSANFDTSVGRLPWPVKGVVVRRFGTSRDKDLNIVTTSNGIDISVPSNTPVRTVSGGKVAQIAYLPTFGNVVIIRHPKSYLTVYANLSRVSVAKGEVIRSGQTLGTSGTMPEGGSVVHFEVWKGKVKQNPERWLR